MPSPVGHALGGAIVGLLMPSGASVPPRSLGFPFFVVVAAAVLPDIDFLWGRHNMETHSLGAAVLAGLAALTWSRGRDFRLAWSVTLAWSTHVLFDWLGSDDTPPLGVMALWPVVSDFYFANASVFEAISRRYWLPNFISHNLLAVTREIAILGPLAAAAFWHRRRADAGRRR